MYSLRMDDGVIAGNATIQSYFISSENYPHEMCRIITFSIAVCIKFNRLHRNKIECVSFYGLWKPQHAIRKYETDWNVNEKLFYCSLLFTHLLQYGFPWRKSRNANTQLIYSVILCEKLLNWGNFTFCGFK